MVFIRLVNVKDAAVFPALALTRLEDMRRGRLLGKASILIPKRWMAYPRRDKPGLLDKAIVAPFSQRQPYNPTNPHHLSTNTNRSL